MFETAELGQTVGKIEYKKAVLDVRQQLLNLQKKLRELASTQVVLLFAGVDGAGKGETTNILNEWMDPRWLVTRAYETPSDVERQRPEFWRYWRGLPARGSIGMFLSAWYSKPILDRVYGHCTDLEFDARLDRILAFERALANDGAAIIKFWMHLSHNAQEIRLNNLEKNPLTQARVTDQDWRNWEHYEKFIEVAECVISKTNTEVTPWYIVEGTDANYRNLTVGTVLGDTLKHHIEQTQSVTTQQQKVRKDKDNNITSKKSSKINDSQASTANMLPIIGCKTKRVTVLTDLDMSVQMEKPQYLDELKLLQAKLHLLHLKTRERGIATVVVFEGPDAAGKGGAIRRITTALHARNYQVRGVAKPTDEELAQHYLWRFWRHIPRDGRIAIFDRSWYGRVLVERVESLAFAHEWKRAYAEINDFENQLLEHGTILVKYWLHVTKEEQKKRFKKRKKTPHKRWKLTQDDWRNRKRWSDYELAVNDIFQYTNTRTAPWTLVEGNDKRFARIKILRTLCNRLEVAVDDVK